MLLQLSQYLQSQRDNWRNYTGTFTSVITTTVARRPVLSRAGKQTTPTTAQRELSDAEFFGVTRRRSCDATVVAMGVP